MTVKIPRITELCENLKSYYRIQRNLYLLSRLNKKLKRERIDIPPKENIEYIVENNDDSLENLIVYPSGDKDDWGYTIFSEDGRKVVQIPGKPNGWCKLLVKKKGEKDFEILYRSSRSYHFDIIADEETLRRTLDYHLQVDLNNDKEPSDSYKPERESETEVYGIHMGQVDKMMETLRNEGEVSHSAGNAAMLITGAGRVGSAHKLTKERKASLEESQEIRINQNNAYFMYIYNNVHCDRPSYSSGWLNFIEITLRAIAYTVKNSLENKPLEVKTDFQDKEIKIPVRLENIAQENKNGENGCGCESEFQCPPCQQNGGCSRPVNGENRTGENGIKPDENAIYKTGDCKK